MEEVRGGPVGPFEDLEVIRTEAGRSTARFCQMIDMPERTWRRWQAKARAGAQPKGPWPRPAREGAADLIDKHALAHPAWGHRKVWAMVRHEGHVVSQATVLRRLRDRGLILPDQFDNEAAFARHGGLAPIPVWSGETTGRVRMTRSGNRQINCAVHRIAITQIRLKASRGHAYYAKKVTEGKTKTEALRCLKRQLVRTVFNRLTTDHNNRQNTPQPAAA